MAAAARRGGAPADRPSVRERAGDFSQTLTAAGRLIPIYDPATTRPDPANPSARIRDAFSGNIIPAGRIDPVGAKIAALSAAPTPPPSNLAGANSFNRNAVNALNITTWTTKIDHLLGDRDRLSGRYILHDFLTYNDVRHRPVWGSVYELPKGQSRLATAWGGWSLGLIVTLQQGTPYGLTTQTNTTNAFTPGPQRVNALRSPELPQSERTVNRWFDTTAVAPPPQFTFGNAGRALLTGPGLANFGRVALEEPPLGRALQRPVPLRSVQLFQPRQLREEPGRALGAANFGVISTARPARILQLGLKMQW